MLLIKSEPYTAYKYLDKLTKLEEQKEVYLKRGTMDCYLARLQMLKMCYLSTRFWGTHASYLMKPLACCLKNDEWLVWEESSQTWEEYRSKVFVTENLNSLKLTGFKYFILNHLIKMKLFKHKIKVWVSTI